MTSDFKQSVYEWKFRIFFYFTQKYNELLNIDIGKGKFLINQIIIIN